MRSVPEQTTHPAFDLRTVRPDDVVVLRGVRTHNLKEIDVEIPHDELTVVTGVSGSGKSSLAFDTLYAEGQRRYTESLSTYARQFLQRMERPPVDSVRSIQPAVALRQKNEINNARSTVSTVTELDDHFQLLFTHAGVTVCPNCNIPVERDTPANVVDRLLELDEGERLIMVANVKVSEEEHRHAVLKQLVQEGFRRLYLDGETVDVDLAEDDELETLLGLNEFPVVIDRLTVDRDDRERMAEAVEAGFSLGKGHIRVFEYKSDDELLVFDRAFRCNTCGTDFVEPQPALFSFNSSLGACPTCSGFGKTIGLDFKKVIPNPNHTLQDGAIAPFQTPKYRKHQRELIEACKKEGVPIDIPFRKLTDEHRHFVKNGGDAWQGIRGFFRVMKKKQYKTHVRIFLARYRGYDTCEDCLGARLSRDARNVFFLDKTMGDIWGLRIEEARRLFDELDIPPRIEEAVGIVLEEIRDRLRYLDDIGLGYLGLDRNSRTLSGGEMQRIHLTTSLGRSLTDTLYVLDEPTAGMHAKDSNRLLEILYRLRDLGNTVVVVEHDPEIIEGADYVVELGPEGGEKGGELVFSGDYDDFRAADTLTSNALDARLDVEGRIHVEPEAWISVKGASEHNLDEIDVSIPRDRLTAITGVSGSGKSTLMESVLYNGWRRLQGQGGVDAGICEELSGLEDFDDVVLMDQSALGRSSRSNALSYSGAYTAVRKLFAGTRQAKIAGLTAGDFSFNSPGGRCEECQGLGVITVEMHFMADVDVPCEECGGRRFTRKVLDVEFRGENIFDVFEMTVDEAMAFFESQGSVTRKLRPLQDVGLGYLRLGQTTSTLSGGEAQRVKLATYIAEGRKRGDTKPVFFIFDEPTVGLHLRDVEVLVSALRQLVDHGHTVAVIEHNIDLVAQCDYVVDLGPGAGPEGGRVVATGTPEEVSETIGSETARYLEDYFNP